jgi:hypothetical protein
MPPEYQYNVSYFSVVDFQGEGNTYQIGGEFSCHNPSNCTGVDTVNLVQFFNSASSAGNYESFDYSFNDTGFTARFYKDERFDILSCGDYGLNILQSGEMIGVSYTADGFNWLQYSYEAGERTFYYSYGFCQEGSFVQDCSFSKSSQNQFLYLSGLLIVLFLFFSFLSLFFIKVRFVLCFFMNCLFGEKSFDFMKFCNPLNGRYAFKWKNDSFYSLSESPPEIFDDFGTTEIFLNFKCFSFKASKNRLTIFKNDKFLSIIFDGFLSEMKIRQVRQLLIAVSMDVNNWPLDAKRHDHFMEMNDFIRFLTMEDLNLKRQNLERNTIVLDLKFEDFMSEMSSLNKELIKVLISHNVLFFGHLNIPCLINAAKRKFGWSDRPISSSNSQWKRYTNDVAKFFLSKNIKGVFYQFKKANKGVTDTLIEALNLVDKGDYTDIKLKDVCKVVNSFEFKSDKPSNPLSEELFEEACDEFKVDQSVYDHFTEEEIGGLDKIEDNYSVSSIILSSEKHKGMFKQIQLNKAELSKLKKVEMSLDRASNEFTSLKSSQRSKAEKKHGSVEELNYKKALLKGDIERLESETQNMTSLMDSRLKIATEAFKSDCLYMRNPERREKLKAQILNHGESSESCNIKLQECQKTSDTFKEEIGALAFYSSIVKRSSNFKGSRRVKLDYKNKENPSILIEIKNRYACLYPGDEKKLENYNNVNKILFKPDKKSGFEVEAGNLKVPLRNCRSIRKCVLNVKYEGGGVAPNCKFKHETMSKFKATVECINDKKLDLSKQAVSSMSELKHKLKCLQKSKSSERRKDDVSTMEGDNRANMVSIMKEKIKNAIRMEKLSREQKMFSSRHKSIT